MTAADPAAAAVAAARQVLGERLVAVLLTGSHAAGRQRPGSDVNLLVVGRDLPAGPRRRDVAREIGRRALWDAGLRLFVELVAEPELDAADPALAGGARPIWGGGEGVERLLRELGERYRFDAELGTWTWSTPS